MSDTEILEELRRLKDEHQTMREMLDAVLGESVQLKEDFKTAMAAYRQLLTQR